MGFSNCLGLGAAGLAFMVWFSFLFFFFGVDDSSRSLFLQGVPDFRLDLGRLRDRDCGLMIGGLHCCGADHVYDLEQPALVRLFDTSE